MGNLVRDNKVMTHKIYHNMKNYLKHTKISLASGCKPYFWSRFCKINTLASSLYFNVSFKHIPDDSYVIIEDSKKDRVLIGIDFNKLLYRDNLEVTEDIHDLSLQDSTYEMANIYLKSVCFKLRDVKVDYRDLMVELRDVFGYVAYINGKDILMDLLDGLNTPSNLKNERQILLDKIANYFSKQLDDVVDDFLSRLHLLGAELPDRDNILLIANINYSKGIVTTYKECYMSNCWNILKGSNKDSFYINVMNQVLHGGNSPKSFSVPVNLDKVANYKDTTLYFIG